MLWCVDVDRNHVLQKTDRTSCCQFLNFAFSTFEVACSYISMDQMQEIWNVFFFHFFSQPGRACSFSDSGVQKGFKPQGLWIVFVRYCDCLQLSSLEHEAFRPYNATIQGPCMAVVSLMGCPHFPSYSQLI